MSAEEPVIAVSSETSEPGRVDPSAVPLPENLGAKDASSISDFLSKEPVTEPPADTAQTAPDDTQPVLLKHDTDIPNSTPTNANGSTDGVEAMTLVNEADNTITAVPVESLKADDAGEVAEDDLPIKDEVNGDAEVNTSGGSDGADLDLADQTLVEEVSRDADASIIQEIVGVPAKILDDDSKKIVVEEGEDEIPEPAAVSVKEVEEDVVPDVALAPEVVESASVPLEEETPVVAEPEPEADSKPESNGVEPPLAEDVEAVVEDNKDEPAPPEEPVVEEPVIEDLEEVKKVEEHAAEIEAAPIVPGSRVEEDVRDPAVEVADVPPVPEEDAQPPAVDCPDHPGEPVGEKAPEVAAAEEPTPGVTETSVPEDAEQITEEPPATEGNTEPRVEQEEAVPPVKDEEATPVVEDVPPTTEAADPDPVERVDIVEPEPVKEVEVTEPENPEETHIDDEPPAPSNDVREVPVDAEPVIARPLSVVPISEDVVESVAEETPVVVDSVEETAPDVVSEENPAFEEEEALAPQTKEVEEPVTVVVASVEETIPVVAEPVEESEPSSYVNEQKDAAPAVSERAVEESTPQPDVSATEPTPEKVSPVEPQSTVESRETEVINQPAPSEEPVVDEAEQEASIPDVPQEEVKPLERPWTPSYSVSSQGGGLDNIVPTGEEASEPTIAPEPPAEEPVVSTPEVEAPAEETTVVEPEVAAETQEPASWTHSYSTTVQGSSPRSESRAALEKDPESAPVASEDVPSVTQDPESEPVTTGSVVEDPTPQPVSHTEEPTTVEPEAAPEEVSETPSWTPSYSTTVQGPSPRLASEVIPKDDPELVSTNQPPEGVPAISQEEPAQAPAEAEAIVEVSDSTVPEDTTPAEEIPAVDAPSDEPSYIVDPLSDQARLAQPEEEVRSKSPWTPSYSVTTLPGSGSTPHVDSDAEETPTVEPEREAEVPPVEKAEGIETPKIVAPENEDVEGPTEPAAVTESPSWAQSYSVTSQPGSPRVSPKAELKEFESEPQPVESVQVLPVDVPTVEQADVPKTVVTPAAEDEDVAEQVLEEELKPAWTQSYSVTSQPGSPRVSPKQVPEEVPEIEETQPSWTQSYSVTSQPGSPRVSPKQVPEEAPEVEDTQPSWTQSYSVISQPGSPRIPPKEDIQELVVEPAVADEPTTVVTPPVEEAATAPIEAETAERPKSPWTPSYSVTTLEGQVEQTPLEDAEPEPEVESVPRTLVGEVPKPKQEIDAPATDTPSSEPLTVKDEQPERPKSPWTPSYSVTTLSGSAPAEEPEPDSVANKPSTDVETPASEPIKAAEDQSKENGTTSDVFEVHEAVSQLVVHDEPEMDVKALEPAPRQLDLPKPDDTAEGVGEKLSWTPSYSVTHLPGASPRMETKEEPQDPRDTPTVDEPATKEAERPGNGTAIETTKAEQSHYFPGVPEPLDEAPEKPKLDLLISGDAPGVSKISPRGRYESSTSSRLFPGAWFSSPKSPGDESRASMEEATGEFILSKSSVAPNEPVVAEAPEDSVPASPITPASPTTKKDKKWRMCEIM